jgi:NAD(P)-dependent dehydrogenase (short-subunit alcohol dehydrogenase family)
MAGRLAGKAAIVTGAGSGIGRAAALLFAREGAAVTVADLDAAAAEAVADEVRASGGRALGVAADVGDEDDTARMAQTTLDTFGAIDVLFANAGVASAGRAADVTLAEWERVIRVHLTGVWLSARAVLPTMVAQGSGSIVAQASNAAVMGVGELAAYSAAKGGIVALARQIAVDYGRNGVRCNSISPGTALTPLVERTFAEHSSRASGRSPEELRRAAARRYPLGRFGEVEEIAQLALYLASDEASWTTGANYVIDGGLSAA